MPAFKCSNRLRRVFLVFTENATGVSHDLNFPNVVWYFAIMTIEVLNECSFEPLCGTTRSLVTDEILHFDRQVYQLVHVCRRKHEMHTSVSISSTKVL